MELSGITALFGIVLEQTNIKISGDYGQVWRPTPLTGIWAKHKSVRYNLSLTIKKKNINTTGYRTLLQCSNIN